MSDTQDQTDFIEVERYELYEDAGYHFQFDRRDFIRAFGAGIVLILPLRRMLAQQGQRQGESGRGGFNERLPQNIGAWIHIDEDGRLNIFTGKVEIGQNIRTSLAQAVAEELHVPVSMIRLTMADTELTPFDMGTFGSLTTPAMAPQLHRAAAAAREVLIEIAAGQLNVEPASVHIVDARFVNHDKSKSLSFADVAKGQALVKVIPEKIATTPAKDWTIAGTSVAKVDGRDFVTGKHRYTSDISLPDMLFGKDRAALGLQRQACLRRHKKRRRYAGSYSCARWRLHRGGSPRPTNRGQRDQGHCRRLESSRSTVQRRAVRPAAKAGC